MQLECTKHAGVLCLEVVDDRIDAAVSVLFKDAFRNATQDHEGRVVIDLANVQFLDSSGLGALVAALKLRPAHSGLELAGLTPIVQKVIALTKMDRVFTIHKALENALESNQNVA